MQHGFISSRTRKVAGEEKDAASRGRNAAERAREYMEESGIQPFLQDLGLGFLYRTIFLLVVIIAYKFDTSPLKIGHPLRKFRLPTIIFWWYN